MKKLEKGFTLVELLVVIAILGILMVALVPNILGAITKSQMQTMAKQGADIVNAINIEVKKSLWPRAEAAAGGSDSEEDIYTKAYTSSTEYFKDLFDIENQTSGEHDPFIDVKIECLWGNGVDKASPGQLTRDNVAWTILAGAKEISLGGVPVLVTRNADTAQFPVSGQNDMSSKKDKINLEKFSTPFGKKGCIVVTKDGAGLALPARECRLCDIYDKAPAVNIPTSAKLKYIEP
ncbi:MAG: type II secretion system protein [Kiritimatiellae bacterium]|nr:type II secretion system protein [Kiritimatiellia bacterium]